MSHEQQGTAYDPDACGYELQGRKKKGESMLSKETLAELTADNTSFSKEIPGLQLVWDTVSTGAIKKCARFYQYHHVEGWFPKGINPHLLFGLITHSANEAYCRAIAEGKDHNAAVRLAVRHCLEKTGERLPAAVCKTCGIAAALDIDAESVANDTDDHICPNCFEKVELEPNHFFHWISDDKNKNRYTLVRTVVWYLDHYKESSEKTIILKDGSPAVELWFRFELPLVSPDGTAYVITGHIDRLTEFAGGLWFQDIKTTKSTINESFFKKFSPDNQMSTYTAAGKIVFDKPILGGIIDGIQVAIDFSKPQRGLIQRTPEQIDEWLKDIEVWIKQAEGYAKAGYWPMNDTACHHFGGCEFRDVCNKSPSIRRRKLETHFEKKVWDPLKKRE